MSCSWAAASTRKFAELAWASWPMGGARVHARNARVSPGARRNYPAGLPVDPVRACIALIDNLGMVASRSSTRRQLLAVRDGATDLDMISAAWLGIAFNAKRAVRIAADTSLSLPHLDAILYLIRLSREDVEAADAKDPAPADGGRILRLAEH